MPSKLGKGRMDGARVEQRDRRMMTRAIALSKESGEAGEYPYGVLFCRGDAVVTESINRVKHDSDVTRHAEIVAISAAQKALRSTSLDDCVIYGSAEPCVFCSYAIRESRIGRVVYGLHSPHMGGLSKWNVLEDESATCRRFLRRHQQSLLVSWRGKRMLPCLNGTRWSGWRSRDAGYSLRKVPIF
jgi:tRNA(Arg) A34 adenosine deaminase TadA